jgi:signal transduction histidine kinase
MSPLCCQSGLDAVAELPWGSHFCHLSRTREDLVETLVPYFATGLANNEQCLWATSEPLGIEDATRELAKHVPDLESKIERGQMRIVSHSDWYTRTGRFEADSVLSAWVAAEQSARSSGYAGVRATWHVSFLNTREQWREFQKYVAPMMTALQIMRLRGIQSHEQEILFRQITHLTRLVDDLLDVSRISRGAIELRKRPMELSQAVIRAIELVSPLMAERLQRLDVHVPSEGLLVDIDVERMAQVLGNLLTNASKYSDARARILLSASREGAKIRCSIKDERIGIAPEMLRGIFDPFVQQPEALDRSRGGLGLGLAIVKSLLVQHGGSVRAASEGLGRGSEFVVELPASQSRDLA